MNHDDFLEYVRNYVSANPDVAPFVTNYVANGLNSALNRTMERAADMEAALCTSLAQRHCSKEEIIISKIEKWKDKSSLNWDSLLTKLREKQNDTTKN